MDGRNKEREREYIDRYILESRNHVDKAWYAMDRALRLAKKGKYLMAEDIDKRLEDIKKLSDDIREILWE